MAKKGIKPKQTEEKIQFKYTVNWQWDLLRYITLDNQGYRALIKVKDYYFTMIEHAVIAKGLIDHYKKHHKIPGETLLREEVIKIMDSKDYVKLITVQDQDEILKLIPTLYQGILKDAEDIYQMCKKFSQYIRIKDLLEEIDPRDWEQYNAYSNKFYNAIEDEDEQMDRASSFVLKDVGERQMERRENKTIFQTPFKQINMLTNANGYEKASVIVLLDKQKKGKTAALVNVSRGYIKMGKKVLYIDLENGKREIQTRHEQSVMNLTKKEILDGVQDKKVKQRFRKYLRIGGEIVVERIPAGSTTNNIQAIIDKFYREHGIKFDVLIVDYGAKLGSLSGARDEFNRISDAYVDIANLALKNDFESVWTANHVTREGAKFRMKTRYVGEDIAKCIDIVRHVHAIFGLNRNKEEDEAGFLRFEIVEQRDGVPIGRAVFTADMERQRLDELSPKGREEYDALFDGVADDEGGEMMKTHKERNHKNDDL